MNKPRVILAIDVFGWSFDHIAQLVAKNLSDEYDFQIVRYPTIVKDSCDILVAFWWGSVSSLKKKVEAKTIITVVYDSSYWLGDSPTRVELIKALGLTSCIGVANESVESLMRAEFPRVKLPEIVSVEDGVDTTQFFPSPFPPTFTLGWTGNKKHRNRLKGFDLIEEAAKKTNTKLLIQDFSKLVPHDDMPKWYKDISVYVCASSSEGTPNPILEAAACGRPCITTDVGITRKVIVDGVSGIFVKRDVDSIAAAIEKMKVSDLQAMGKEARLSAEKHDWSLKIKNWRHFLSIARACIL